MLSVRRDICRNERQWAINQGRVTYSMVKGGTRTEMDPRDVYINMFEICIEQEKVLFQYFFFYSLNDIPWNEIWTLLSSIVLMCFITEINKYFIACSMLLKNACLNINKPK